MPTGADEQEDKEWLAIAATLAYWGISSPAASAMASEDKAWLAGQGLTTETLPKSATWYRADGLELNMPTDPYYRTMLRGKGWTLKPPSGVGVPSVGRAPQATQPANVTPVGHVAPKQRRTPRLSRAVLGVMDGKDTWEGTATELMALLDPYAPAGGRPWRVVGMPLNAARLSKEIKAPRVTEALEASGVTVSRGYRGHERVLRLSRR